LNEKTLPIFVFEGIVLLGTIFVGSRAVGFIQQGKARGAIWAAFSTIFGIATGILGFFASRITRERNQPFKLTDEILGFSALGVSVLFLFGVLSALLPVLLDALERRTFTSFVAARHVRATKSGFLTVISVLSMT
jgi:lipoprotein-releasing system permease protein